VDDSAETQQTSVRRTIAWARRCKAEFVRLVEQKRLAPAERPLLFGVIQGGGSPELRRQCAEALLEIGFDGYGYGGWPLDSEGELVTDMVTYTRALVPSNFPMHALGIGHPLNIVACAALGYGLFDSALPTRDARRGRLYTFTAAGVTPTTADKGWFRFLYIADDKHIKATQPISEHCDCLTCRQYSRGYLRHLFKSSDATFMRLATIHNLRFMMQLMAHLAAV
jgi:queuine tRNA-ribosyltransferase